MDLHISSPNLAGRLSHYAHNWALITQDRWVLQAITGYQLELTQKPYQARKSLEISCSLEEQTKISQEVKELLAKGAIIEAQLSPQSYVSQIFLVEKKGGGQRPVINLKGLNNYVRTEHFKMEGLHLLPDMIQPADWMVKLDLKDAYLQVPIHQEHQSLLQFQWQGKTYQFVCLPFGLTSAPRVFTKVMKPVVGLLRQMGIRLVIYLDDILIMHHSKEELLQFLPLICQLFKALGLMVNLEKSQTVPKQEMEFLGFQVNSASLQLAFPAEKMRKIQQDARALLQRHSVSVRDLARFVGKVTATTRAIWQAPLHYRALQRMINSVVPLDSPLPARASKFNTILQLTEDSKKELSWWISLDRSLIMTAPLLPRTPDMIIESDASNTGWGARHGEIRTGGVWSRAEALNHINYLELLAAHLAVQCFAKQQRNITIQLRLDNVTAVTYINKMGGTHSQLLCDLATQMWEWSLQQNIFLSAEHLPGRENVIADEESRTMRDRCDWMLNPHVFEQIQSQIGPCRIDLFASRLTRQLPRFFSWRPDPEAEKTDAFSQDWSTARGYANPPWCLIGRCLSQIKRQNARVILITPLWNTQPWFPALLGLTENYPRLLPASKDLVLLPSNQEFLMKQGVPDLVAWPISGNPSHHKEFLQKLLSSSCPPGGQKLSRITTPCLPSGHVGVSNGVGIPLLDL